jgi:hypothetical protein
MGASSGRRKLSVGTGIMNVVTRNFEGTIRLPRSVFVAEDALGQTFTGALDPGAFSLTMPKLPDNRDADIISLVTPFPHSERLVNPMNEASWGYVGFAKSPDTPRPLASWVDMVVVRIDFSSGEVAQFYELAKEFGAAFDSWYAVAVHLSACLLEADPASRSGRS